MTKLIIVNNLYASSNGADIVARQLYQGLKTMDDPNGGPLQVRFFAGNHPESDHQGLSLEEVETFPDIYRLQDLGPLERLSYGQLMFYHHKVGQAFRKVLKAFQPDLIHFHGINRYLSPSVIEEAHRMRIPMVMTLHDAYLLCPASSLLRGDGQYCHGVDCTTSSPFACVQHRCMRGSLGKSVYMATEFAWRRYHRLYHRIHHWITPSLALKKLMSDHWPEFDESRCSVIPNVLPAMASVVSSDGADAIAQEPYFLFIGRLVREKGIFLLLDIAAACPEVRFKIAGTGPDEMAMRQHAQELQLTNVEFLGFVERVSVSSLFQGALATILPCHWFETFGLTIIESYSFAKPVIASRIGAIPELIEEGKTGWMLHPEDVQGFVQQIKTLWNNPEQALLAGQRAKEKLETLPTQDQWLQAHASLYQELLATNMKSTVK